MIKAKGKFNGKEIEVTYDNGKLLFNDEESKFYSLFFEDPPKINGIYEAEDNRLNIINVLQNAYFFDKPVKVQVIDEDIPEMPIYDINGAVY